MAKRVDGSYRAGRIWLKIRHADTVDVTVLAVAGSPRRPRAALVALPGGSRALTSPQLTVVQARQLAEAVDGHLQAEVLVRSGRHRTIRYVRLR